MQQMELSHAVGGSVNLYNILENYLMLRSKSEQIHVLWHNSFIPRYTYTNMWALKEMSRKFVATLFIHDIPQRDNLNAN